LGPNTGAIAPRALPKAGLGVGCWRGWPPPTVRVRGYHLRKIFQNSDAKSCILVTTCCEISCFLKTTAKKLGDQYIVGPPTCQSPPVPTVVAPMVEYEILFLDDSYGCVRLLTHICLSLRRPYTSINLINLLCVLLFCPFYFD